MQKVRKFRLVRINAAIARRLLVFVAIFGALGGYWLLSQSSASTPVAPKMYLKPSANVLLPETEFSVQVRVSSGQTTVNAVQANFNYPTHLFEFVGVDVADSDFPIDAPTKEDNGNVFIARGVIDGVSGDKLVATVRFRTLSKSATYASMEFAAGSALLDAITNQDILGGLSAVAGATLKIDGTPPIVSIVSPANGASIGIDSTVTVRIRASDTISNVAAVELYMNGNRVASLSNEPYAYSWSTAGLVLGSTHAIQAKAIDELGHTASSAVHTVTITDKTKPTAAIVAPLANSHVHGEVPVIVNATDNTGDDGISKVELYSGSTLIGSDNSPPYEFTWDTASEADGLRSLSARAYDNAEPANVGTGPTLTVRVDNRPPSAPGKLVKTGHTGTSIAIAWTDSTDTVGMAGYRVTEGGRLVATLPAAARSHTLNGLEPRKTYILFVTAFDAAGNESAPASLQTPTGPAKSGDINDDGSVSITDLSILLSNWRKFHIPSDLNGDGPVNITDLSLLLSNWGNK